jgi:hypothetical protein
MIFRGGSKECLLEFIHVKCKHEIKTLNSTATIELIDEKLLRYLHFCR